MRFRPARDDALLVELDGLDEAVALVASLRAEPLDWAGEPVPGERTVLVPFDPVMTTARDVVRALRDRPVTGVARAPGREIAIPTVYDGADLADVAGLLGWTVAELVRRHTSARFVVGFVGFAPGFAYLTSDDAALVVPRRTTPRTRVPVGSVAMAGPYSGVYPRESPGGWQLLGRTGVAVWDQERDPPALWRPGDRVRFVDVGADGVGPVGPVGSPGSGRQSGLPNGTRTADLTAALEVVDPGVLTIVEDLGRPGIAAMGVSTSGALDARSLRAANRVVGNPVGAAGLETTGGLRLRARGRLVVSVTGAAAPLTVHPADGGAPRRVRASAPTVLADGDELDVAVPSRGMRCYVAVRGGVDVEPVLGSRATDVLAGLGPGPLRAGDTVPVGPGAPLGPVALGDAGARDPRALPAPGDVVTLPLVLGPRDDWFDAASLARLADQEWEVTARSNRVGLHLRGHEPLQRSAAYADAELPSEGCVTGALQVPSDGQPVLFLADHPLTGGYPVVGAVRSADVGTAGQLPPGARVRFAPARAAG